MKSLSHALKSQTVRLGVMAAFVFTFMGLPSYGAAMNVDTLKKLDVFGLGENFLGFHEATVETYTVAMLNPVLSPDSSASPARGQLSAVAMNAAGTVSQDSNVAVAKTGALDSLKNFFSSVFSF